MLASVCRLNVSTLRVCGLGFGVWGLEFGVWGLGFRVWGSGFRDGLGLKVCDSELRV